MVTGIPNHRSHFGVRHSACLLLDSELRIQWYGQGVTPVSRALHLSFNVLSYLPRRVYQIAGHKNRNLF